LVEDIVPPDLREPVKQRSRVLAHDPRLFALVDELRDELAHPLVAAEKHRRIVVVADIAVIQHVLEVADDLRGAQIVPSHGNERLVHVQGHCRRAPHPLVADAPSATPG
jgi:hypothetical protein